MFELDPLTKKKFLDSLVKNEMRRPRCETTYWTGQLLSPKGESL